MNNKDINAVTGFKFAEIADVVFSGIFLKSQVNRLNIPKNTHENLNNNDYVIVKNRCRGVF